MSVVTKYLEFSTQGDTEIVDLTPLVKEKLDGVSIGSGIVTVSCIGSTGAVTTCEFEPGLVQDIKDIFRKLIPAGHYHHDAAWGDGNGHSHLRASIVGPSVTVPFVKKRLELGTWQQIIFIDFDNRPRDRRVVLQFVGD